VSSTTVVTGWAERTAELHRAMMPQKDNLCGAFWVCAMQWSWVPR
jgi:hypothetical protein